jgi:NADH dehydrogenase
MISEPDEFVTVFGGGGFIGRYVCEFLLQKNVRVRVASRNPRSAHFIQPLAQVGQIGFVQADIAKAASVERAVDGATGVVNLCGRLRGKFHATHVEGARNVAEAARAAGLRSLVQVSAIGADTRSPSRYGRTKGEGEAAVRSAFPNATVLRPSLVFGPEDNLTNRFAGMARLPVLPLIAARRNFQPVYVVDLAQAIATATLNPSVHGGKTYEIGGPQVMSMEELHKAILEITCQTPEIIRLPDFVAGLMARFGWIPGAPLTRDQWLMLQQDNVPRKGMAGLEAFGIKPMPLSAVGYDWLGRFNRGGKFAGRRINLTATS